MRGLMAPAVGGGMGVEEEVEKPLWAREDGRRGVKAVEEPRAGVKTPERKGERKGGGRAMGKAEVGREAVEGGGGRAGRTATGARIGIGEAGAVAAGRDAMEVDAMGGRGAREGGREVGGGAGGVAATGEDALSVSVVVATLPSSLTSCFSSSIATSVETVARFESMTARGVLLPPDPASLRAPTDPPFRTLTAVGLSGGAASSPATPSIGGSANFASPAPPFDSFTGAGEPSKTSRTPAADETLEGGRDGRVCACP